jgi:hypothetical protein
VTLSFLFFGAMGHVLGSADDSKTFFLEFTPTYRKKQLIMPRLR